jgi:2-keto-4-pentenoate hydratase/2-oxohepta-3-ene-1,7-dioic acid hydratase in catechol pathway
VPLLRIGPAGAERPAGLTPDGRVLGLSSVVPDIDGRLLDGDGLDRVRAALPAGSLPQLALDEVRVGPPIARPGKIVCIGLNDRDHAAETGAPVPVDPVVFLKASDTMVGPYDDVLVPRGSTKTDWEVELAVVIARRARYLAAPEGAHEVIAGYALSHDVSEREFQLERGGLGRRRQTLRSA